MRSFVLMLLGVSVAGAACAGAAVPRSEATPSQERGQRLYAEYCQQCHGGATGGRMNDLPPPHNANGHTWHHPDCQLARTILRGPGEMSDMMRRMVGAGDAPRMPAFQGVLDQDDVTAILSFIKTWWTEDQRRSQASITARAC